MYGPPGMAYVYRSYGIHWCMNVVAAPEGIAGAVLIRGVDPLEGGEVMARRREGRTPLTAGPGRLTQALGITGALDGHPLDSCPLRLVRGVEVPDDAVDVTPRIGITRAVEAPLRYLVRGRPGVSR
jgi:DNA-3-methyladenine glycosylase